MAEGPFFAQSGGKSASRRATGPVRSGWLLAAMLVLTIVPTAVAQLATPLAADDEEATRAAPGAVEVEPSASDESIARRLGRILESTGWFEAVDVRVDAGVVFLSGTADSGARRDWAEDLARQTESVVAVVNRIEVPVASPWDLRVWRAEIARAASDALRLAPKLLFASLVLVVAWLVAGGVARLVRWTLRRRAANVLLLDLAARLAALIVFVVGLYVVLRVLGLTRLAVTLLGGTGVAALVLGIAFRDIMENFLASVLISLRRPFSVGDVVELAGKVGVVQKVTTRGTLLMSFDGNHVQIPNATVYKSEIVNYTANPKRRMDFALGIGYGDAIAPAQQLALGAMREHPAVLESPEPLVLVEELGAATVDLRLYFWYDGTRHDGHKIRSALIRNVKHVLEEAGVSMPDAAREVIFPQGVPISEAGATPPVQTDARRTDRAADEEASAVDAEGGLESEQQEIRAQAASARSPEEGEDLLTPTPEPSSR